MPAARPAHAGRRTPPGARPARRGATTPCRHALCGLALCVLALCGLAPCGPALWLRAAQAGPPSAGGAAGGAPARPVEAWLAHEDGAVRALQAFELRQRTGPGVVAACTHALAREAEARVLLLLLRALATHERDMLVREGGAALVEALLALRARAEAPVREDALALLARLPPRPLGHDEARLRGWWQVGREALLEEQARLQAAAARAAADARGPGPAGSTVETRLPLLGPVLARLARDGLELVLVLDATGSMGPVLAAAKAQCRALARRLALVVPRVRLGLVTYDDAARVRVPLTPDVARLEQGLARLVAAGGGDPEEGVDKGLGLALQQEAVGWSRRALRHVVLVGDAPPHEGDVRPLLLRLVAAGEDELFEHPVVVHAISTDPQGVPHFAAIARAGRGAHLALGATARLADEIACLPFGAQHRALAEAWLEELLRLQERLEAGR